MTFYLLGESDHSVLDTIAQLTEGRSARDQPSSRQQKKITKMGKDTLERCYNTPMQVAMNGSLCIAKLFTKDLLVFLARFGFGLHTGLHILGCFAAC